MKRFLSAASFRQPSHAMRSAWLEHGPFAFWLMEQARPRLTVELGTFSGFSFLTMCEAAKAFAIAGRVVAVDTWRGDPHTRAYDEAIYSTLKATVDAEYAGIGELHRMKFSQALDHVADGTVDLLHVDGLHFYENAREDHQTWLCKLSDRAIVLFHDTQVQERGFGVHRYWAEVCAKQPGFEFHHGYGLGVVAHGRDAPEIIRDLTSPSRPKTERQDIRNAYARLGLVLSLQGRVAELQLKRKPMRYAAHKLRKMAGRVGLVDP